LYSLLIWVSSWFVHPLGGLEKHPSPELMNPLAPVSLNSSMGFGGLVFLWLGHWPSCFRCYYQVLKELNFQDTIFNIYLTVNHYDSVLFFKNW